ncbi:DUF58 domain-containing protein [Rhodovulum marinum]|uniref:Uncharacterized protein DUF58 n=1 Tax=Rhodovulum marinum TaxID=320662 RepID=A0A4R2PYW3_9RHOB|nr:DUF58 domain-containing protein [Rhodovulum marinum]TCP40418.1 uncharacterized protein DUF58 [Rhodovulum marinum]
MPAPPGATLTEDALIALRPLALRHPGEVRAPSGLPGGVVLRRRGQGQEFNDIRAYVAGDDIRHLDAQATARTGELHVKTFQDERDRTTVLVADFRPSMLWGLRRAFRSVAAAEALTLLGWQVAEAGGRVALAALIDGPPVLIRPRPKTRGMLAVIGGMVAAHRAALEAARHRIADPPLDHALAAVARVAPTGARVVIASGLDTRGPRLDDRLAQIDRRCPVTLWHVGDGADALPAGRYPIRTGEGRRLAVRLAGAGAQTPPRIAGLTPLPLDPAWPVEDLSTRLGGADGPA